MNYKDLMLIIYLSAIKIIEYFIKNNDLITFDNFVINKTNID